MSRVVWFAAGAGAGVYAMTKARRVAAALTPEGLGDRLAGLSLGLHLFREEVQLGMAEKENELRERLGLALHGATTPELSAGDAAAATSERPAPPVAAAPPDAAPPDAATPDAGTQREGND